MFKPFSFELADISNHYDEEMLAVPKHTQEALMLYLIEGLLPGRFISAMLAGDLFTAVEIADTANKYAIYAIGRWIVYNCPHCAKGSYDAIKYWSSNKDGHREKFKKQAEQNKMWDMLNNKKN